MRKVLVFDPVTDKYCWTRMRMVAPFAIDEEDYLVVCEMERSELRPDVAARKEDS